MEAKHLGWRRGVINHVWTCALALRGQRSRGIFQAEKEQSWAAARGVRSLSQEVGGQA